MFEIIFLTAAGIYFIQLFLFLASATKKYTRLGEDKLPSITIIVASRNEESNIGKCLVSLDNLIYPEGKIEIIMVNDKSTDGTGRIIEDFIHGKDKFKLITTHKTIGNLRGKTNALANALEIAKGEVILTTDADCEVSPAWAKSIASYYQDGVAMVCGYTTQEATNNFEGMQTLDFIFLLTVASGTMNLNMPLSCIGNNMSYRKSVYDEVGGYESIPFSITEDFKLLKTIFKLKKYKIIWPLDEDALVTSQPCKDYKTLYWQKKRWGVGGLDSDLNGFLVMASGFISHVAILVSPFFFSANVLYMILFKLATDFLFLYPILKNFRLTSKLGYFLSFQLYYIIYVIALPLMVLVSRKVIWKGRSY
ncbi:MAG: glycosyltransferase [Ignavibacteria bacterium]